MESHQRETENYGLKDYIIKSLPDNLAVLDIDGTILYVNDHWRIFASHNGLDPDICSEGTNYLNVCDYAYGENSKEAPVAAQGIRDVITGKRDIFELEYPCHAPDKNQWYLMKVIPVNKQYPTPVLIYHLNITERKLAEIELQTKHEQISKQNQIRKILTGTIPTFLKDSPKEKRRIVIKQMLDMVEKCVFQDSNYQKSSQGECQGIKIEYGDVNSNNIGKISCEVMNQLGGNFSVDSSNKNEVLFAVKGTECPWGADQAKLNPILCNLTKGIISRVVTKEYNDAKVETLKTMGNGDDYCYFIAKK